ncbi:nickel/cobalt transporter [Bradyrhizobium erythrophlei]|uniref:nickel/cobalt transporter n=1 Tax=Bradyrhizobium erythrophlei TaxID=1437360 RepID=UPI0035E53522
MTPTSARLLRGLAASVVVLAVVAALDGAVHALWAQNPFGAPRAAAEPQAGGIIGWLLAKQSEFYREISATIRAAKSDGSAVWTLLVISFAYGIFHAAGPGHGKAVISSYLVANHETARRGIVLSFASALLQSLVAVVVVGICAWLLNATAKTMCGAEKAIEITSYALIAAFGARLVWVKGGGFIRALQMPRPALAVAGAPHPHDHDHHHHGHHHHHADAHHEHGHDHDHGHDPHHVHDEHCGHSHGPTPAELAGPGGWQRGLSAIVAVGLRPCSGAILVLVFALAQGLFWAGIAATFVMGLGTAITVAAIAVLAVSARGMAERLSAARDGGGMLIMRGLEFGAAGLVLLFGLGLLFGYVAAERVTCL